MSDEEISQFADLIFAVRAARRKFLAAALDPSRWDAFGAAMRRRLRDAIVNGELDQALRAMTRQANDFRTVIGVEAARQLKAIRVAGSDSTYQLDETQ